MSIETEQEDDGRWLAEIPDVPGCMAYGATKEEAIREAVALGLRILADRVQNREVEPSMLLFPQPA